MATSLTPMTLLEAVNDCLEAINEAPVNTLVAPLPAEAAKAVALVGKVSRTVQAEGLHCNTELGYPLVPDVDGFIDLPTNCMKVDLPLDTYSPVIYDVVMRGGRLYDRLNRTYEFDSTLYANVVLLLDFDDLPHAHREYIAAKAARELQQIVQGEEQADEELREREMRALAAMRRHELNTKNLSLLRARGVRNVLRR